MQMTETDLHRLELYDYILPPERIAQFPAAPRDSSRLLVLSRKEGSFQSHIFLRLPDFLTNGDVLVLNDTRVIPARLRCERGEILLVRALEQNCWDALVFPGKRFKPGTTVDLPGGHRAHVLSASRIGRIIQIEGDVDKLLHEHGGTPLPPYIERNATEKDRIDYQTVYAKVPGSVAAPTAGLHFTQKVLKELKSRGIRTVTITLHVGPGTFRPVKAENITHHRIDPEFYSCSDHAWTEIRNAERIIAVGTTTTRTLETIARTGELQGFSDLFIFPGFQFQIVQGLLTNFHLPKSSLLMLVSAFGGRELIRRAYDYAIDSGYRFYSYGDAMLIL